MPTAFLAYKSYTLTSTHAIPNGRSTPILTTANNHYHYYYNNNRTRTSGRTYNIVCGQNKENAGSYGSLSAVLTQSNGTTSTDMVVESGTRTIPTTTTTIPLMKPCDGIGIVSYLKGKNYLITGATGFLAKAFVEKMLRTVPDVGKIFLLIKANDKEAAIDRLKNEAFMMRKLVPVAGNVCESNLGMDPYTANEIANEVDVIINSAANTTFDESAV
uniref:Fatty acyl-CoA reductase n=1 Tax=Fagus sylvatica TaxID=28930 RepID=A0A2N9IQZ7_FAGSY